MHWTELWPPRANLTNLDIAVMRVIYMDIKPSHRGKSSYSVLILYR